MGDGTTTRCRIEYTPGKGGSWEQTAVGRTHSKIERGETDKESMENIRVWQKQKRTNKIKMDSFERDLENTGVNSKEVRKWQKIVRDQNNSSGEQKRMCDMAPIAQEINGNKKRRRRGMQ